MLLHIRVPRRYATFLVTGPGSDQRCSARTSSCKGKGRLTSDHLPLPALPGLLVAQPAHYTRLILFGESRRAQGGRGDSDSTKISGWPLAILKRVVVIRLASTLKKMASTVPASGIFLAVPLSDSILQSRIRNLIFGKTLNHIYIHSASRGPTGYTGIHSNSL